MAAWDRARTLLSQRDGWKAQSTGGGASKRSRGAEPLGSEVVVFSRDVEKLGKVLRAEARIDASPLEVFEVTTLQLQTSPSWNKTVIDCQVLQVGDGRGQWRFYHWRCWGCIPPSSSTVNSFLT